MFCERSGSYLHDIFNADAAISPARAIHRVHIREGRLIGLCDQEQGIVSEVARILTQDLHRSAVLAQRSVRRRLADDCDSQTLTGVSMKTAIFFWENLSKDWTPCLFFCTEKGLPKKRAPSSEISKCGNFNSRTLTQPFRTMK